MPHPHSLSVPVRFRLLLGALAVFFLACASAPRAATSATGAATDRYVFSYFKGNGEGGLHLAYSEDGLRWRALDGDSAFFKAKILYDHDFSVIDAFMIHDGARYVMFLKDETLHPPQKNIRLAYAGRPEGPWTRPTTRITGDYWAEGPTALHVGNQWLVYFDRYREHRYGALASTDLKTWGDVTAQLVMPDGIRHGTAFRVPAADAERLLAHERR
jgi:hypothetical protein